MKLAFFKAIGIAFILIGSFYCKGQRVCNMPPTSDYKKSFVGNVKRIRFSHWSFNNPVELRSIPFDTTRYYVDSFNNSGCIVARYFIDKGEITEQNTFKYDVNGNLVEDKSDNGKGRTRELRLFSYNALGNLLIQEYYWSSGSYNRVTYTYLSGLLVQEDDSMSGHTTRTIYKYNEEGNIVEKKMFIPFADTLTYKYTYDDKGNKILEMQFPRQRLKRFVYDEQKNPVLTLSYDKNGDMESSLTSEYKYDTYGNWTRRIQQRYGEDPIIYDLIVRDITYY